MKRYSKLATEILVEEVGKIFPGLPFIDFLYQGGEVFHKVSSDEDNRVDLLAYEYLNDFRLWPLIAWYNGIRDPLTELPVGTEIIIPIDPVNFLNAFKANTYRQT